MELALGPVFHELVAPPAGADLLQKSTEHEGMSQIEVGGVLGISDEAVESLLARARRTLKAALKDDWQELMPQDEA